MSEDAMALSDGPTRRLLACVEAWPECTEGLYDQRCCRFPKSCSCTVYSADISDAELEPSNSPIGPDTPPVTGPARTVEVSDRTGRTDPDVP